MDKEKEQLIIEDIKNGLSYLEMAKKYKVSCHTIRPLYKIYGRSGRNRGKMIEESELFTEEGYLKERLKEKDSCKICQLRYECDFSFLNRAETLKCDYAKYGCTFYLKDF